MLNIIYGWLAEGRTPEQREELDALLDSDPIQMRLDAREERKRIARMA